MAKWAYGSMTGGYDTWVPRKNSLPGMFLNFVRMTGISKRWAYYDGAQYSNLSSKADYINGSDGLTDKGKAWLAANCEDIDLINWLVGNSSFRYQKARDEIELLKIVTNAVSLGKISELPTLIAAEPRYKKDDVVIFKYYGEDKYGKIVGRRKHPISYSYSYNIEFEEGGVWCKGVLEKEIEGICSELIKLVRFGVK